MYKNKHRFVAIVAGILFLGAACTPGTVERDTDGGIYYTEDAGETWVQRNTIYKDRNSERTIDNIDIAGLFFSPGDARKIFAITKREGLWVSWNAGHNWDPIMSNSGLIDIAFDRLDPKIIYAAIDGSIAKTIDEGVAWKGVYTSDTGNIKINSIVIDPKNQNRILAATNQGTLLISDNAGVAWRVLAKTPGALYDMQYHPNREQTIYAGSGTVGLVRSRDNGSTWEDFSEQFAEFAGTHEYRDFVLIPSGVVYASRYGLLRSLNHGQNWASLPLISGAKDSNIQALAVNPGNPLEIYYGTNSTFYVSLDGGLNWIPRTIPTTRPASDVIIDPSDSSHIYLGVSR